MSSASLRRMIRKAVEKKLIRIRKGSRPTVLDLFSGCGGIALGFEHAGFTIVGGVERDPHAAESFKENFFSKRDRKPHIWLTDGAMDITATDPDELTRAAGVRTQDAVDVLVGGPPCQAFSRIGRAKLRSVSKDPEAWLNDPRRDLYKSYLRFIAKFAPCAIMMENVPDFLGHGSDNMAEEVCSNLAGLGYRAWYTLMNASSWGVPQHRERMILVAIHESAGSEWSFAPPMHRASPPSGYRVARAGILARIPGAIDRHPSTSVESTPAHFLSPPDGGMADLKGLPPAIPVRHAIGDLPRIPIRMIGPRFSQEERSWNYRTMRPSAYATMMRTWHGHAADPEEGIIDHFTRFLPRDFKIFATMGQGEEYPEMHLRQTRKRDRIAAKKGLRKGSAAWKRLTQELIPPYPPEKFPNKWWRLISRKPSRTLLAHLGKDGYTHIHPEESRVISVREAARLQSFPDGFCFSGPMNSMFRQIGNAVPPLLAHAVATSLLTALRSRKKATVLPGPPSAGRRLKMRICRGIAMAAGRAG